MAKKKKSKKKRTLKEKIFGDKFNIWDVVLLALVVPYFYMVFIGYSPETGMGRVYFNILGPAFSFAIVVNTIVKSLKVRSRK